MFQKMSGMEKVMNNRGLPCLSVGTFSYHSAEKLCEAPHNVSQILGYRKILCILEWCHDFPSKILSLTGPKENSANLFIFHKVSALKKTR